MPLGMPLKMILTLNYDTESTRNSDACHIRMTVGVDEVCEHQKDCSNDETEDTKQSNHDLLLDLTDHDANNLETEITKVVQMRTTCDYTVSTLLCNYGIDHNCVVEQDDKVDHDLSRLFQAT